MSEELVLGNPSVYSTESREKAAIAFRITGNIAASARQAEVPSHVVRDWAKTDWWKEYQEQLKSQNLAELNAKLSDLAAKAFIAVEDRLQNGDLVFDQKSGEMVRKPINAEVANRILQDSLSKSLDLEKLQNQVKTRETEEKVADRLVKLAKEFAKFANSKTIEGTFDAVHDKREAGLQEGTSLGAPTP